MNATEETTSTTTAPAGPSDDYKYIGPPPQRFTVGDGQLLDVATAAMGSLFRLGSGVFAAGYSPGLSQDVEGSEYSVVRYGGRKLSETSKITEFKRPAEPLVVYEFDGCPYCKKVREALTILDIEAVFYPCPKNGPTWRPKAIEMGGKKQFPYVIDPNTDKAMYESDDIIAYLFKQYGDGQVPLALRLGALTVISAAMGSLFRRGRGTQYRASKLPAQPLVLWGYEASPFVRLVKETLTELELPHSQVPAGRGSPRRQELLDKRGHFQVPYLEDPNEKVYLFESAAIIKYLEDTYKA